MKSKALAYNKIHENIDTLYLSYKYLMSECGIHDVTERYRDMVTDGFKLYENRVVGQYADYNYKPRSADINKAVYITVHNDSLYQYDIIDLIKKIMQEFYLIFGQKVDEKDFLISRIDYAIDFENAFSKEFEPNLKETRIKEFARYNNGTKYESYALRGKYVKVRCYDKLAELQKTKKQHLLKLFEGKEHVTRLEFEFHRQYLKDFDFANDVWGVIGNLDILISVVTSSSIKFSVELTRELEKVFYQCENRIDANDEHIVAQVKKDLISAYVNYRVVAELKGLRDDIDLRVEYNNITVNYLAMYHDRKAKYMMKFRGRKIKTLTRGE